MLARVSFAFLAATSLATAALAAPAERRFAVSGFEKVLASGSEDITITTGKTASVVATGPQERLDNLNIQVDGKTLKIDHKKNSNWSWGTDDKVQIVITMPALLGLHASGSGDIMADKGSGPAFEGTLSGSGNLKIDRIESPEVTLRTSGSGDIMAGGQCTNAKVSISGSGDMALGGLACTNVDIAISGSGDVIAHATGNANIRISGSGDVKITGGARCTSRTSGSGDVTCG
jgi:Putative auto-transporter adhesin, head GIN domain